MERKIDTSDRKDENLLWNYTKSLIVSLFFLLSSHLWYGNDKENIQENSTISSIDTLWNPIESVLKVDSTSLEKFDKVSELFSFFYLLKDVFPKIEEKLHDEHVTMVITKEWLNDVKEWYTQWGKTHRGENEIIISLSPECWEEIIAPVHEIAHVIERKHNYAQLPEFRSFHKNFYDTLVQRGEEYYTTYWEQDTSRACNEWFATLIAELLIKKIQYSQFAIKENDIYFRPINSKEVNRLLLKRFLERYHNKELYIFIVACFEKRYDEQIFKSFSEIDQEVEEKKLQIP